MSLCMFCHAPIVFHGNQVQYDSPVDLDALRRLVEKWEDVVAKARLSDDWYKGIAWGRTQCAAELRALLERRGTEWRL